MKTKVYLFELEKSSDYFYCGWSCFGILFCRKGFRKRMLRKLRRRKKQQLEAKAQAQATAEAKKQARAEAKATAAAQKEAQLKDYADAYAKMEPKQAAAIFINMMSGNIDLVAKILQNMPSNKRADIIANMDALSAAQITAFNGGFIYKK